MNRKLQLQCPGCKATLKITCGPTDLLDVTCPKCGKQFAAKVPPSANVPAAPIVAPVVNPAVPLATATPVTHSTAQVIQPQPVQPQPVQPHAADMPQLNSLPQQPMADAWADMSGSNLVNASNLVGESTSSYTAPAARRKPNPKLWIIPLSILGCVALLVPIGIVGYSLFRDAQGGGGFSLAWLSDSHEQLLDDYFAHQERSINFQLDLMEERDGRDFVDEFARRIPREVEAAEGYLLRAVRLGKAPVEMRQKTKDRMKALQDKYEERMLEGAVNGRIRLGINEKMKELLSDEELKSASQCAMAASAYITRGMYDLPAPQTDTQRIYYDEAGVVRELFLALGRVNSKRQSQALPATVDDLAEKMLDIAVRRSQMSRRGFDSVPMEYRDIENVFRMTQFALLQRIESRFGEHPEITSSVAAFDAARQAILDASSGASEADLRQRLTDARAGSSVNPSRSGRTMDLAYNPPPSSDQSVALDHQSGDMGPARRQPNSSFESGLGTSDLAGSPVRDYGAPGSDSEEAESVDPFAVGADEGGGVMMEDMVYGPMRDFRDPEHEARMRRLQQEREAGGRPQFGTRPSDMGVPRVRSGWDGPPQLPQNGISNRRGRAMVRGTPTAGVGSDAERPSVGRQLPSNGQQVSREPGTAQSVTIRIFNYSPDGGQLAKSLAASLNVTDYSHSKVDSQVTIHLQYAGRLSQVAKQLEVGKLIRMDTLQREIHVDASQQRN